MAACLPVELKGRWDLPAQLNKCANCRLFNWEQPEQGVPLLQCKKCKVLQYCSKPCQEEHWVLVHKEQCRDLVKAKKLEVEGKISSRVPVGIFSHHPFPKEGLPEDTIEILTVQVHRILIKMRLAGHPAHANSRIHDDLLELEKDMQRNRHFIWAERKIRPQHDRTSYIEAGFTLLNKLSSFVVSAVDELWPILLLVWEKLCEQHVLRMVNSLKEPRNAVPLELWEGLEDEVGLFPTRLQELLDALTSSTQLPSFKELLSVFCGGSLEQNCTFCGTTVTVVAVAEEGKGCEKDVPTVCLLPFLPILFCCGGANCAEDLAKKIKTWYGWAAAARMTHDKLALNKCDFCFKLAENVHR